MRTGSPPDRASMHCDALLSGQSPPQRTVHFFGLWAHLKEIDPRAELKHEFAYLGVRLCFVVHGALTPAPTGDVHPEHLNCREFAWTSL